MLTPLATAVRRAEARAPDGAFSATFVLTSFPAAVRLGFIKRNEMTLLRRTFCRARLSGSPLFDTAGRHRERCRTYFQNLYAPLLSENSLARASGGSLGALDTPGVFASPWAVRMPREHHEHYTTRASTLPVCAAQWPMREPEQSSSQPSVRHTLLSGAGANVGPVII